MKFDQTIAVTLTRDEDFDRMSAEYAATTKRMLLGMRERVKAEMIGEAMAAGHDATEAKEVAASMMDGPSGVMLLRGVGVRP